MQTDLSRLGIRLLFAIIDSVVIIASLPLLAWFPITKKSFNELVEDFNKSNQ